MRFPDRPIAPFPYSGKVIVRHASCGPAAGEARFPESLTRPVAPAMKNTAVLLAVLLGAVSFGCSSKQQPLDIAQYELDNSTWRAQRVERLKGPEGYLNLAGLFWLAEGSITIGSSADNDIVFPGNAAPRIGSLEISADGVILQVVAGVVVTSNGKLVDSILIADDTTDAPVTISQGSMAWTIIKRDERFALRLRDYEHPAIAAFPPIEYFALEPALIVSGRLQRFAAPKILKVDTVIEGLGWQPQSPGVVSFEIDGQSHELEAYAAGDELFFVFGDLTSGRETYPAGRFLYADLPADSDEIILDFNRAYNPPCAFNDFATCPVASPKNRLPVRIAAGEKFDPAVHSTPDNAH